VTKNSLSFINEQVDKKKLRDVCREIGADLGKALYLQWILDYNKVEPILNTLLVKIKMFIDEEVELQYEEIIKKIGESFEEVYLRGGEEEKRRRFKGKIRELEEYLKIKQEEEIKLNLHLLS